MADLPSLRIRLEYFDQTERFAVCLPRTGRVVRRLTSTGGMTNWCLVELDEPIQYELRGDQPAAVRWVETRHLLIRSRWHGHEVGEPDPTSVFLLLVEQSALPLTEPIVVEQFRPRRLGDGAHARPGGRRGGLIGAVKRRLAQIPRARSAPAPSAAPN